MGAWQGKVETAPGVGGACADRWPTAVIKNESESSQLSCDNVPLAEVDDGVARAGAGPGQVTESRKTG